MFSIIKTETDYIETLVGLKLDCCYPIREIKSDGVQIKEWQCETEDGRLLLLKYYKGLLGAGIAEREYDVRNSIRPIGTANKVIKELDFSEIIGFMDFKIKKENYWN